MRLFIPLALLALLAALGVSLLMYQRAGEAREQAMRARIEVEHARRDALRADKRVNAPSDDDHLRDENEHLRNEVNALQEQIVEMRQLLEELKAAKAGDGG